MDLQTFLFGLIWFGIWKNKSFDILKQDITNILIAYETKPEFRKQISEIIQAQESLNALLTVIGKQGLTMMQQAGVKLN